MAAWKRAASSARTFANCMRTDTRMRTRVFVKTVLYLSALRPPGFACQHAATRPFIRGEWAIAIG